MTTFRNLLMGRQNRGETKLYDSLEEVRDNALNTLIPNFRTPDMLRYIGVKWLLSMV